eukprot:Hpha_TRINITY_DN16179_c3_g14::TRINITY_DN16179_c3_g14_i1::g.8021::m.8021
MADDDHDVHHDSDEEEDTTLKNRAVIEKYKLAGGIVNKAMEAVLKAIQPGATVVSLATIGDDIIIAETDKCFRKGKGEDKVDKGVAFPTCVNVNNVVCHYAPLEDDQSPPLAPGDVVKVDMGCHVDGFCAVAAQTVIVTEEGLSGEIPKGDRANVVAAGQVAIDAIAHCFRPGAANNDITDIIATVAKDFDVTPVAGVLSHEMKRYIIDGSEVVAGKKLPAQHVHASTMAEYQVWALDIAFSSAPSATPAEKAGNLRVSETRPLIYKRALDTNYQLKLKGSREVFSDLQKRFQTFPFGLRFLDPKKRMLCMSECLKHDLVQAYPVLESRKDEIVAHFKTTILITANQIEKITGVKGVQSVPTEKSIVTKEAVDACSRSMALKKKAKKKKKSGGGGAAAEKEGEGED